MLFSTIGIMTRIIQKGEKTLRGIASEVPREDIGKKKMQDIIKYMRDALDNEEDGVAIAAPQIDVGLRIFVVSHRIFVDEPSQYDKNKGLVFINPELLKTSKEKDWLEEGCLSVRWWYGKVERSKKATVRAYDEKGLQFTMGASGLLAQIFQHEIDHLNGVLFSDKAIEMEELPPEKE